MHAEQRVPVRMYLPAAVYMAYAPTAVPGRWRLGVVPLACRPGRGRHLVGPAQRRGGTDAGGHTEEAARRLGQAGRLGPVAARLLLPPRPVLLALGGALPAGKALEHAVALLLRFHVQGELQGLQRHLFGLHHHLGRIAAVEPGESKKKGRVGVRSFTPGIEPQDRFVASAHAPLAIAKLSTHLAGCVSGSESIFCSTSRSVASTSCVTGVSRSIMPSRNISRTILSSCSTSELRPTVRRPRSSSSSSACSQHEQ